MGFFKDFKEDASQAVKELMPEDELELTEKETEDDLVVNTLEGELDVESELSKLNGLLESVPGTSGREKKTAEQSMPAQGQAAQHTTNKEESYMSTETEIPVNTMEQGLAEELMASMQTEEAAAPQQEKAVRKPEPPVASDEVTVITEGSSITGNIQSNGSIDLQGTIIGDVQCNGKLTVTGHVRGNTNSAEFFADNAKLEGEVTTTGTVKVGLGSVVIGNITATSAVIAGAIKGDIDVQGPVVVDTSAVVMGNIKSRSVQINNGAVIEGFCSQSYADVNVESLFSEE